MVEVRGNHALYAGAMVFLEVGRIKFDLLIEDVAKNKTTLAGQAHAPTHATCADETLGLDCRVMLAANTGSLTVEVEYITGTDSQVYVLVVA